MRIHADGLRDAPNLVGEGDLQGMEGVVGSPFGDSLGGNELANDLVGLAGDDTLAGRAGNDNSGLTFSWVDATDLGNVQVLKHANLYLLTDQFGDIHSDSRGLGLYCEDTRLLSCSVLRIGGARPVMLQGSTGANFRGGVFAHLRRRLVAAEQLHTREQ